ncbi:MAG: hypothetical protein HRU33_23745 [Rhodobacteraceae bacterium]|nr:hypothetical protein [Paracoccaceae bacterium]
MNSGPTKDYISYWAGKMNNRGHATTFGRGSTEQDKRIIEASVLAEWVRSASSELSLNITDAALLQNDPPDAKATVNGLHKTIELTELVDGDFIADVKRSRNKGKHRSAFSVRDFSRVQWDRERFFTELNNLISKKDKKYSAQEVPIDILIVYSDEPWLTPEEVSIWMQPNKKPRLTSIGTVHVLLTYSPGYREYWPIFSMD